MGKEETQTSEKIESLKDFVKFRQAKPKKANGSESDKYNTAFQKKSREMLRMQKVGHRGELLRYIMFLSKMSFWALISIIAINILGKIIFPGRDQLVSDTVIQYFIIGVFAEILGVVAIVAKQIWHD